MGLREKFAQARKSQITFDAGATGPATANRDLHPVALRRAHLRQEQTLRHPHRLHVRE